MPATSAGMTSMVARMSEAISGNPRDIGPGFRFAYPGYGETSPAIVHNATLRFHTAHRGLVLADEPAVALDHRIGRQREYDHQ